MVGVWLSRDLQFINKGKLRELWFTVCRFFNMRFCFEICWNCEILTFLNSKLFLESYNYFARCRSGSLVATPTAWQALVRRSPELESQSTSMFLWFQRTWRAMECQCRYVLCLLLMSLLESGWFEWNFDRGPFKFARIQSWRHDV